MDPLDLPALAALAEAATPGPWKRNSSWVETDAISDRDDIVSGRNSWTDERFKNSAANLTYIAAADPTTILALIRRAQVAEAELLTARQVVEAAHAWKLATIAASKGDDPQLEYEAVVATGNLFDDLTAYDAARADGEGGA